MHHSLWRHQIREGLYILHYGGISSRRDYVPSLWRNQLRERLYPLLRMNQLRETIPFTMEASTQGWTMYPSLWRYQLRERLCTLHHGGISSWRDYVPFTIEESAQGNYTLHHGGISSGRHYVPFTRELSAHGGTIYTSLGRHQLREKPCNLH